jgi:hypothetical protein
MKPQLNHVATVRKTGPTVYEQGLLERFRQQGRARMGLKIHVANDGDSVYENVARPRKDEVARAVRAKRYGLIPNPCRTPRQGSAPCARRVRPCVGNSVGPSCGLVAI